MSQAIIPYIPTDKPRLGHLVYEMILAHFWRMIVKYEALSSL